LSRLGVDHYCRYECFLKNRRTVGFEKPATVAVNGVFVKINKEPLSLRDCDDGLIWCAALRGED